MYSSNSLIFAITVLCLGSCCLADSKFEWTDCGSESGSLIDVVVKDCFTKKCPLKRNENASLTITFKSKVASSNVTAVVNGEVLGFKQKFNLPNPYACEEVGLTCPLEPDCTYTYTNTIFVKPKYPRVSVDIYWELKDDDGENIFCAIIPAQIVSETKKK
ncbi:unnamed protein product [Psylliodes chrysocephalus]|uniref:MD-2-related lipid-recognition domain-containing protein n=1 Tax=Psylliodes chrysocephalus TaxID=3402493 RepID=A0A9P0CQ94_9CUCU|nr:unnamed protein product [Psylliodes chrysocephala]